MYAAEYDLVLYGCILAICNIFAACLWCGPCVAPRLLSHVLLCMLHLSVEVTATLRTNSYDVKDVIIRVHASSSAEFADIDIDSEL